MKANWKIPEPSTLTNYQSEYIRHVQENDLPSLLQKMHDNTLSFARNIPESKLSFRYMPGKWTIPELFMHIIDSERVFSYRMLRIARNDKTDLPGYEENEYIADIQELNHQRSFQDILDDYSATRKSTIRLVQSFPDAVLDRFGFANKNKVTVKIIGYMLAGHEMHHLEVIKSRYL